MFLSWSLNTCHDGMSFHAGRSVGSASDSAACGFPFKEETEYLIYATGRGEGEKKALSTSLCARTKPLANAKEDLDALGEGKKIEAKK